MPNCPLCGENNIKVLDTFTNTISGKLEQICVCESCNAQLRILVETAE